MQQTTTTWRERAVAYLRRYTCAMQDIIERFVGLFWDCDLSDEENLLAFESYEAELQNAYSF